MSSIRNYFTSILIAILVLFIAGCSGGGSGAAGAIDGPIQDDSPSLIDDLFGELSSPNEDVDGDDGDVSPDDADTKTNGADPIDPDPLSLNTAHSKKFDDATHSVEYDCNTTMKATGGVGEYSWVVSGLPEGMKFDDGTRRLKGAPVVLGEFEVVFTVTDEDGNSEERKKALTVKDDFVIDLRYGGEKIDDESVAFNEGGLGLRIVNGHASDYTWTVLIDGNEAVPTPNPDSKAMFLWLPERGPDEQLLDLEISVVDEFGNDQRKSYSITRSVDEWFIALEAWDAPRGASEELGELEGINFSVTGGKPQYVWDVEVDSAEFLDEDGDVEKTFPVRFDDGTPFPKDEFTLIKGGSLTDDNSYFVAIKNLPKVSGIKGYRISGSYSVADALGNKVAAKPFEIEKTESMDTLNKLKMVCDFEDIDNANDGKSSLRFDFYGPTGEKVARVHYDLALCNDSEKPCERPRDVEPLEDDDGKEFDLSEIRLNEISNVKLRKHKNLDYKAKLDVDLQWCRFYTDNWFAIWDDQKHGDDLNENEVGGNKGLLQGDDATRKYFIIDRFEGYKENSDIWFMNDMLDGFGVDSEDGFDYVTIKDNDGKQ
jgi:putative Ig domain-containing protein